MGAKRKTVPIDVRRLVLHEAGYKCSNPTCRCILTLDVHHLVRVSDEGNDAAENLLALCPNCHALHHKGEIPPESIRAWKMLLLAMNEAYDRKTVDLLLTIDKVGHVFVSSDGLLVCATLVASNLVEVKLMVSTAQGGIPVSIYNLSLTRRGRTLLDAWRKGDQSAAVEALADK